MRGIAVPVCPSCGSVKTGYYLPDDLDFQEIKLRKYQKGERVRPFPLRFFYLVPHGPTPNLRFRVYVAFCLCRTVSRSPCNV